VILIMNAETTSSGAASGGLVVARCARTAAILVRSVGGGKNKERPPEMGEAMTYANSPQCRILRRTPMRALRVPQPLTGVVLAVVVTFGALSAAAWAQCGAPTDATVPSSPYPSFGCKPGWTPNNNRTGCCPPGSWPSGKQIAPAAAPLRKNLGQSKTG
jgi:hypothetical protein